MKWGARVAAGIVTASLVTFPVGARAQVQEGSSIEIVTPAPGATVTGTVEVVAAVPQPASAVLFEWAAPGEVWTPLDLDSDGSDGWSALWDTSPLSGAFRLRASVADPASSEEALWRGTVDNEAPSIRVVTKQRAFSPNGDGRKDATRLSIRADESISLQVEVRDRAGDLRRRLDLGWHKDGTARLRWKGRSGGKRLPDGRYRLVAVGVDAAGLESRSATSVVIDTRRPRLRILRIGPDPSSGGTHRVHYRVRDRARRLRFKLIVSDRVMRLRNKTWRSAAGRGRVEIAPRYGSGALFLPGRYRSRLIATDDAGNMASTRARPWRLYRDAGAQVYSRLPEAGNKVAITLDDCYWDWAGTLDALKAHRVKATYFCPGQVVMQYPELAQRTVREGHTVGSHGWDHALLTGISYTDVKDSLLKARAVWWAHGRETSVPYMRPPYGGYDSSVVSASAATGHSRVIMWDVDSLDYLSSSAAAITQRVVSNARGGSIILLHTKDVTATALPGIIEGLRRKGLEPVSLPRLFRAAGLR